MPLQDAQHTKNLTLSSNSSGKSTTAFIFKTLQTYSGIEILDQNALLFNIVLEKAKHNLAYNKRKTTVKKVH